MKHGATAPNLFGRGLGAGVSPAYAGWLGWDSSVPGAYAPGFIRTRASHARVGCWCVARLRGLAGMGFVCSLGLTPQALFGRVLRTLGLGAGVSPAYAGWLGGVRLFLGLTPQALFGRVLRALSFDACFAR